MDCNKSENGFFGEYGSLIHKILEKYEKGELSLFELNDYYEEHFSDGVPHDAPPNKYVDIKLDEMPGSLWVLFGITSAAFAFFIFYFSDYSLCDIVHNFSLFCFC